MTLQHRQQLTDVGCIYFSAHAVTGDASLLEHLADTSAARYQVRLVERGLLTFTLFCSEPPEPPAPVSFWERLRARFTRDNHTDQRRAPLLVSICGITPGWLHQVALLMPAQTDEELVCISDSNFSELHWLTWDEFLTTVYARAHRVEILGPLELDAYPETTHPPGGTP